MSRTIKVGVIGGGLMGREVASAFGRWFVFKDSPVIPELVAVCDLNPKALDWFRQVPSVDLLTTNVQELLARPDIDVIYAAVPHNLHERLYLDILASGKDLLAEKPFGLDLAAARNIEAAAQASGRFVRCSSEFPFMPSAQRAVSLIQQQKFGRILEVSCGLHHSSDLDPSKAANWKRFAATCGEIGVMGDLGMHVLHIPLRLGWKPESVYAQLQKGYPTRPDGSGGTAVCDTFDNAALHTWVGSGEDRFPMRLEMKRLAPGEMNSWYLRVLGTEGGVSYSTKEPKTLHTFRLQGKEQLWQSEDVGFASAFPTITGGIFEVGFPDVLMQMWAAFFAEREGGLDAAFGCVTPAEARASHEVFAAALESQETQAAVTVATS